MENQKFDIGDKVTDKRDPHDEVHEILAFFYDPEKGFTYKVTAKEVDVVKKEIINGISFYGQGELKKVKEEEK